MRSKERGSLPFRSPVLTVTQRARDFVIGVSCVALPGCGSAGSSPGFASGDGDGGDAAAQAASAPAASASGGSTPLFAQSDAGDAGPAISASACTPGTYSGTFTTAVTIPDAGLLSVLFSIAWSGSLSVTLVGEQSTSQSGEFSNTTLVIAPGAKLTGTDQYGGTFSAGVSGQLDCPSRTLSGTLDGSYTNSALLFTGDGGTVTLNGTLSGTYDSNVTPVALDNGSLSVTSPQVSGLEAAGTWSATLQ
jgi:hypothetical protein